MDTITEVRYPWFIICQFFQATLIYFLFKPLISPLTPLTTSTDAVYAFCKRLVCPLTTSTPLPYDFILFQHSLHFFSTTLFLVFSPPPFHRLSPIKFLCGLLKLIFVYEGKHLTFDYKRRVYATLKLVMFVAYSGITASVAVVSISGSHNFGALGLRGFVSGLMYALHYKRWVMDFPIVQRCAFFHYKLGFRKAVIKAVKLSNFAYLLTLVLSNFTKYHNGQLAIKDLIMEQIVFYLACVVVFSCWELNRNLLQIFLTKRLIFDSRKGSKTNPSDHLLTVLEDTTSILHVRYLAYYDLCMVSESNVDTYRRLAFFEETGGTYRRVIVACLKPLEQLTRDLSSNHSNQSCCSRLNEPFYEFQIFAWCARIVSSLTVCSYKEDHFGVAKLSGSNAAIISTFLGSLLAVETLMRNKKDNMKYYSKAYSMADILRTSIYEILSVFHEEMVASAKAGHLQNDWITSDMPLYGSRELLVQKLHMFLEFQAN